MRPASVTNRCLQRPVGKPSNSLISASWVAAGPPAPHSRSGSRQNDVHQKDLCSEPSYAKSFASGSRGNHDFGKKGRPADTGSDATWMTLVVTGNPMLVVTHIAMPRVPGRANPTKTGGGKLVDLQAYAKRCDDRVQPSGKRSQPEAEQVPPVQDDRVQGPAGIRAASGPLPDTSFPRARGATWIAGAADDVEWDAPRAGMHVRESKGSGRGDQHAGASTG